MPRSLDVDGASSLVTATANLGTQGVVGRGPSWVASATVVDMAKPTTPEASDRLGNLLPTDPSAEDVERQADRLQIVPDLRLSSDTINRVPLDDLEQRRLRALGR